MVTSSGNNLLQNVLLSGEALKQFSAFLILQGFEKSTDWGNKFIINSHFWVIACTYLG